MKQDSLELYIIEINNSQAAVIQVKRYSVDFFLVWSGLCKKRKKARLGNNVVQCYLLGSEELSRLEKDATGTIPNFRKP